ncbi:hypothetical protein ACFYYS_40620, partial [Streptomyces sp. NPDC002120]
MTCKNTATAQRTRCQIYECNVAFRSSETAGRQSARHWRKRRTMQKFATTTPVSAVLDIPAGRIRL